MLVPFPFHISSACFTAQPDTNEKGFSTFSFSPAPCIKASQTTPDQPELLVSTLLREAAAEGIDVDIVLFPELSLDDTTFEEVKKSVACHTKGTDKGIALIAGVASDLDNLPINRSRTAIYKNGEPVLEIKQAKHHRWKLDPSQVKAYGLSNILKGDGDWWENTKIDDREISYVVFKKGVSFTTLICEDLARSDPCIDSLLAIGPNLIFALLMDGPQITGRWPERNALGFSDDPGSSVLTLTSLGMVLRSNAYYNGTRQTIALWRDQQSGTREIDLPLNKKGMILGLKRTRHQEYSLDGRGDGETAYKWDLQDICPLVG